MRHAESVGKLRTAAVIRNQQSLLFGTYPLKQVLCQHMHRQGHPVLNAGFLQHASH